MSAPEQTRLPLAQIHNLLLTSDNIAEFLDAFVHSLARSLSTQREVYCTVTLLRPKRPTPVASSHEQLKALDEIQHYEGDGPCLTAARENRVVYVPDTREDTRWPDYGKAAADIGIYTALGVPLDLDGEAAAALDVYSDRPQAFDEPTIALIKREVHAASSALRLALRLESQRDAERDLKAAMSSRTVINLAVGIVMGQNRCSQEQAVDILVKASNHRNLKLRDLATELVAKVGKGSSSTHFER